MDEIIVYVLDVTRDLIVGGLLLLLGPIASGIKPDLLRYFKSYRDRLAKKMATGEDYKFLRFHYFFVALLIFCLFVPLLAFQTKVDDLVAEYAINARVVTKLKSDLLKDSLTDKDYYSEFDSLAKAYKNPRETRTKVSLVVISYDEMANLRLPVRVLGLVPKISIWILYILLVIYSLYFMESYSIRKSLSEFHFSLNKLKRILSLEEINIIEADWAIMKNDEDYQNIRKKLKDLSSH